MKTSVQIKNFKQLEDVTLEIKPLTLLFGPNGSGKSSFLKALSFLSANIENLDSFNQEKRGLVFNLGEIDLNSYKDIITNNDVSKEIEYVFNVSVSKNKDKIIAEKLKILGSNSSQPIKLKEREMEKNKDIENDPSAPWNDHEIIYKKSLLKGVDKIKTIEDFKTVFIPNDGSEGFHREIDLLNLENSIDITIHIKLNINGVKSVIISDGEFSFDYIQYSSSLFDHNLANRFLSKGFYHDSIPSIKPFSDFDFFKRYPEKLLLYLNENEKSNFHIVKEDLFNSLTLLFKLYVLFPRILSTVISSKHFHSLRPIPRGSYLLENNGFPQDNYYDFNFFIEEKDILREEKNSSRDFDNQGKLKFWKDISSHLKKLNLANNVYVIKKGGVGYVMVKNMNGSHTRLNQTNSGLLQLLPILTSLPQIKDYEFEHLKPHQLLIEQPELHLHPKVQSQLVEIFYINSIGRKEITSLFGSEAKAPKYYYSEIHPHIIETHSEHIVKKLQVLVAKGKVDKDNYIIYYFDNRNGKTKARKMEIADSGFFKEPWPDGFFDETSDLAWELMKIQAERQN